MKFALTERLAALSEILDFQEERPSKRYKKKISEDAGFAAHADGIDFELVGRLSPLLRLIKAYFRIELHGIDSIPTQKGCLFVSNHAVMGVDSMGLYAAVYLEKHRLMRGLAEHFFYLWNFSGQFVSRLGMVDGNRENAVSLLKAGEWVLSYPGGVRESFKPRQDRYRLHWRDRLGYLRCALAAGSSIVPVASIGVDDAYYVIGHEKWIARRIFRSKRYDWPLFFGIGLLPFPVKFRYIFDQPIDLKKQFGLTANDATAPDGDLIRAHKAIWNQTQVLIEENLHKRFTAFF